MTDVGHRLVVVGDVAASRQLGAEARRRVQEAVRAEARALSDGPFGFRVTGGDEFEWVLPDRPGSWDDLLRLRLRLACRDGDRPPALIRVGAARGEVWITGEPDAPYTWDGPCFHRARRGMQRLQAPVERAHRSPKDPFAPVQLPRPWTVVETERPEPLIDATLRLTDDLMSRWTMKQTVVIRALLEGVKQEEIARLAGVSPQAVSQRLYGAHLDLFLLGHGAVRAALWPEETDA